MRRVLKILRDARFYAKLSKCSFFRESVAFLGHVISGNGVHVDPIKVQAIRDWPLPKNPCDIRRFLGLSNYFNRFVQGYSTLVAPLVELTKSKVSFNFDVNEPAQLAFENLKEVLCEAPVLQLADPDKPYEIICDASGLGCGSVLLQEGRPVAYQSYKFEPRERRYPIGEQELLAVIKAPGPIQVSCSRLQFHCSD